MLVKTAGGRLVDEIDTSFHFIGHPFMHTKSEVIKSEESNFSFAELYSYVLTSITFYTYKPVLLTLSAGPTKLGSWSAFAPNEVVMSNRMELFGVNHLLFVEGHPDSEFCIFLNGKLRKPV